MTMPGKGLYKLVEECGELLGVAGKKLAYFHTNEHPDGAGPLLERIEQEAGDVLAAIDFVMDKLGLDYARILERRAEKLRLYRQWDADPTNAPHALERWPL